MKNSIFLSIFLALVLVPVISFASFDVSLKYGSKSDAVIELQDFLTDQNVYTGKSDGKFGLGTLRAVKAFQTANGLTADGYFGIASRTKASSLLADLLKPSDDAAKEESDSIGTNVPGCTSTTGFSITTGQSCSVSLTFPAGCTSTSGYSSTTGTKCDGSTVAVVTPAPIPVPDPVPQPVPAPVPPLTDLCPNIDGNQSSVPTGMEIKDGKCLVIVVVPSIEKGITVSMYSFPTFEVKSLGDGKNIAIVKIPLQVDRTGNDILYVDKNLTGFITISSSIHPITAVSSPSIKAEAEGYIGDMIPLTGSPIHLNITVPLDESTMPSPNIGSYRVKISGIKWNTTNSTSNESTFDLLPAQNYTTGYQFVNY